jgi:hypothetical protein
MILRISDVKIKATGEGVPYYAFFFLFKYLLPAKIVPAVLIIKFISKLQETRPDPTPLTPHPLGLEAVRMLQEDILPVITIEWVNEATHRSGVTGVLTAMRKKLSLVDCVSFDIMRKLGIKKVFAYDPHFKEQGFMPI